jgi:hypothetical protein
VVVVVVVVVVYTYSTVQQVDNFYYWKLPVRCSSVTAGFIRSWLSSEYECNVVMLAVQSLVQFPAFSVTQHLNSLFRICRHLARLIQHTQYSAECSCV